MKQIDFRIAPKKFVSETNKSDAIFSSVDHNQKVSKIHFFYRYASRIIYYRCIMDIISW